MALLRSVHRTPAPPYSGVVLEDRAVCVGPLAAEPQAVVSHDVTPSARRAGLLDLAPTAAARGERSPGGRWWRAQVAEDRHLHRTLAVASYVEFHGLARSLVTAHALALAAGDEDAAAWRLRVVERARPRWNHARRLAGREGGIASGRSRAAAALEHRRTARKFRAEGRTVAAIMSAMRRSRSAVQTWLNTEPAAALVARAEAHAADQSRHLDEVCARVQAEKEKARKARGNLFERGGPTNVLPLESCISLLADHLTRKGVEPPPETDPEPAASAPKPPPRTPPPPRRVRAWTCVACHPEREAARHLDRCPECRPEPRFLRGGPSNDFR